MSGYAHPQGRAITLLDGALPPPASMRATDRMRDPGVLGDSPGAQAHVRRLARMNRVVLDSVALTVQLCCLGADSGEDGLGGCGGPKDV